MSEQKIIAVTGGTGFIGRHVVSILLEKGYQVKLFSRKQIENPTAGVISLKADLTDKKSIKGSLEGCSGIIHLAGYVPEIGESENYDKSYLHNVIATKNIFQEAMESRLKKFVFISGWHVYGEEGFTIPIKESEKINPGSVYSRTKSEAEKILVEMAEGKEIQLTILRICNVYGEYPSQQGVLMQFIKSISSENQIEFNPKQARDYLYVKDAASAIVKAVETDTKEKIFNIGSGKPVYIKEIAESAINIYKKFGFKTKKPRLLEGPAAIKYLDTSKARHILGFAPQTNLLHGIEKTVLWFESSVKRKIEAVIFDLDGTLLDVTERYYLGYKEAASTYGLPIPGKQKILELKKEGLTGFEILKKVYPKEEQQKLKKLDKIRASITNSNDYTEKDKPFANSLAALEKLKSNNLKLFAITLRPKKFNRQLANMGLVRFFNGIMNIEGRRAKTAYFIKAAKKMKLSTFECISVGDSPGDISGAKKCGVKAIGAEYGLVGKDRLLEEKPDYIAKSPDHVLEIILSIK